MFAFDNNKEELFACNKKTQDDGTAKLAKAIALKRI